MWPPAFLTPVRQEELEASDGPFVIDFANTFCRQTKDTIAGKSGQLLVMRPWQEELLRHVFAKDPTTGRYRHRIASVFVARKNGKSVLGSVVALHGLFYGPLGAEVYSCAADRDQARIVFNTAKRMIELEPELNSMCKIYRDVIEVNGTGSIFRVLSSEAYSKEGLNPSCVVADETHAWQSADLWDVLALASGARESPIMLSISTAGVKTDTTGQDSIAYRLFQYGEKLAKNELVDESFFMASWTPPLDAKHDDPKTWAMANPALGDLNSLEEFESAVKRTPEAEFRIKRCNQWVSSQNAWLPSGSWDKCKTKMNVDSAVEVCLGFDGSFSNDSTVIVGATCTDKPHLFLIKAWERPPHIKDWRVDIFDVENTIVEACKKYNVREVVCDPYLWSRTIQQLGEAGLPMVEYSSGSPARMVPACKKFYDLVTQERLTQDGNPLLARHLQNAVLKIDQKGPRITKEHRGSPRKIDGAVACVIAADRATVKVEREEKHEVGFFAV